MRRYVHGIALLAACIVAMTASCRRTQPSLIDRNQPPDTQLWYAPPDSSDYVYTVHMYWRGIDSDGTATRFIWAIQDTIAGQGLSWNPALRLRDYRVGRVTTRTDSVFSFTAYKDVSGVGVRKNRQAFFVASIDDNGVIDPQPAAVEFVATIATLPEMRFTNHIDGVARPYTFTVPPRDTVGMYLPFEISYHGKTVNGRVRAYQYFPLSTSIVIEGANVWSTELDDTTVSFANTVSDPIPAGVFRFAAKCLDDAGAESQVDAGQFKRGVTQIVVNFDPDTWMTKVDNTFYKNQLPSTVPVNYTDAVVDTVPNNSWISFYYDAHDARRWDGSQFVYRDTRLCSLTDPDECINFQVKVFRENQRQGLFEDSQYLPPTPATHDSDPFSTADSNTVSIGTFEYDLYAAGLDENGTRDGTPARVHIVGNFDPTLDSFSLVDHLGNPVNTSGPIDTLDWNFYKGIGWPYTAESDTLQDDLVYFKEFGFTFDATGHDDSRDPDGSSVRAWRYQLYTGFQSLTNRGTPWGVGRSGVAWIPGDSANVVSELAKSKYRYNHPQGDDLFADLEGFGLGFVNQLMTMVVEGRDTGVSGEPEFTQIVFWDQVLPDLPAGTGVSKPNIINQVNVVDSGRWTQPRIVQFYLRFHR